MIGKIVAIIGAVAAVAACDAPAVSTDAGTPERPQVIVLDDTLSALRDDFNAARGDIRLVFVAGPTCGPCLRGLADMSRVLGEEIEDDPRLHGFVVYVPTLSAELAHAERATRFLTRAGVRHYWDASWASGPRFADALGISVNAWDVWLVFGPDAEWTEAAPPAPDYWRHQLAGLPRETRLDPDRFAADVRARLEELP